MIKIERYEEITQISMSREIDGRPVYWVSAYLVDGLLIDSGCYYTADELVGFLKDKEVEIAVNTHFHEDHVGANRLLMNHFGFDIFAHPDSVRRISEKIFLYPYQETVWGYPEPTVVREISDEVKTKGHVFKVIETPGHSAGHIALVEMSKGWCFSGDIFAREKPKFIRSEEDVSGMIKSMKTLIDLPCEKLILLTSVGKIIEDGRKALSSCMEYLKELSVRARRMNDEGLSEAAIMDRLFGGEHNFSKLTDGHYSSNNFVRSLMKAGTLFRKED